MAQKYSNNLPTLVIRHYQNGDLLSKIADFLNLQFNIWSTGINQQNVLVIVRSKRKTRVTTDRLIQRKLKFNR